jgi:hypothetical protein
MRPNPESGLPRPLRAAAWLALVSTLALLLAGCAPQLREYETGPWVEIAPGGTLTLHRDVPVRRDRARVFLRGGRLSPIGASLGPSCGLEVRTIDRDGTQQIPAGTWRITRIQNYWAEVAEVPERSRVRLRLADAPDGGGNPMVQEGYHFWLEGGPSDNLMRMTCLGMLDDLAEAVPPTLVEIDSALGRIATLELAGVP